MIEVSEEGSDIDASHLGDVMGTELADVAGLLQDLAEWAPPHRLHL